MLPLGDAMAGRNCKMYTAGLSITGLRQASGPAGADSLPAACDERKWAPLQPAGNAVVRAWWWPAWHTGVPAQGREQPGGSNPGRAG